MGSGAKAPAASAAGMTVREEREKNAVERALDHARAVRGMRRKCSQRDYLVALDTALEASLELFVGAN